MGQTLTNGIYLPDEGERNCYSGLAANWNAVDTLKGNYSLHAINVDIHVTAAEKETWNGKADNSALTAHTGDTTIHVTAEDKQTWNGHVADSVKHVTAEDKAKWDAVTGKADASALTAHTGDTTIHVTAEDKAKWDAVTGKADASALTAHTGDTTIHVTAEDKAKWDAVTTKANDAEVMHLSGDESASGNKNFRGLLTTIPNASLWPVVTNTSNDITLLDRYAIHVEQISSGKLTDLSAGAWNVVELGAGCFLFRSNSGTDIRYKHLETGAVNRISVVAGTNRFINDVSPNRDNTYDLGSASYRWRTINGINPGALSLPDISAGVDISGYITLGTYHQDTYTPPSDGYISIMIYGSSANGLFVYSGSFGTGMRSIGGHPTYGQVSVVYLPVRAGTTYTIENTGATNIGWAKFYPCTGNV